MRAIRLLFITVLALLGLVLLALILLTTFLDPNDYKSDIETLAKDTAGVNLSIEGNIDWSLYPWLGLSVGTVEVKTTDLKPFTKLEEIQARVSLVSLFKMQPQVQKLVLNGLELNLEKDKDGNANWEKITTKTTPQETETAPQSDTPSPDDSAAQPKQDIKFAVEEVAVTQLKLNYQDAQTGQSISINPLNIVASNISLDSFFPLNVDFNLKDNSADLAINSEITSNIRLGKNFESVEIKELKANTSLSGKPFNGKTVPSTLAADILADLANKQFTLSNLAATFANLTLQGDIKANTSDDHPALSGQIAVPAFSLQQLLESIGKPAIVTSDPSVLQKIAFSTNVSSPKNQLSLSDILITLDDTQIKGAVLHHWLDGSISAALEGNSLNADRYLPPKTLSERDLALQSLKTDAQIIREGKEKPIEAIDAAQRAKETISAELNKPTETETVSQNQSPTDETAALLPVETLRALLLDAKLNFAELTIQALPIKNIAIEVAAKDGLVEIKKANGELFDGNFKANALLDASKEKVIWKAHQEINNIQSHPLIKTLADLGILSGGINFTADINSTGNSIADLKANTLGDVNFFLKEGALEGFNLTQKVCSEIANISKKPITKTDWENKTRFTDLSGKMSLKGLNLSNPHLIGSLAGIKLTGKGDVSVENSELDYQVALTMVGDEAIKACNINEKFKDIPWPIRCKGSFDTPPLELCKPDTKAFGRAIEKLAKKEVKRKANKEVDKLFDKHSDKLDKLDKGTQDLLKNKLKGLF